MRFRHMISVVFSINFLIIADNVSALDIQFSGYGTVAVGTVIGEGDEPYLVDPVSGGEYDDNIRFQPESMAALRTLSAINEKTTATIQFTAKGAEDSNAEVELAFISYLLNPETTVNGGRFRLPLFYYSDFLDAAYAYHWIRPPIDLYGIPTSTITGINIVNTRYFDAVGLTTQLWYGEHEKSEEDFFLDFTKSQGINVMLEYEWLRLRAVYHTLNIGIDVKPFLVDTPGGLNRIDPDATVIRVEYMALGFMVDYDAFIWRSEYTRIDNESNVDIEESAYGSLGYLIGEFTPHYTYSYKDAAADTETHTIGVRWDFMPATAFKFEYSNFHYETDGGIAVGPEYRSELISIALDFVF